MARKRGFGSDRERKAFFAKQNRPRIKTRPTRFDKEKKKPDEEDEEKEED